jgi:hypothetical protein
MLVVAFDKDSIQRSSSGQITAKLCLRIGGQYFPDEHWDDFAVVVLQWWLTQAVYMLSGQRDLVLRFMDGPFECRLERLDDARLSVKLYKSGSLDGAFDEVFSIESIIAELTRAAEAVLGVCKALGWTSPETDALQFSLEAVRNKTRS